MNTNRKTKQILIGAVVVAGVLLIPSSDGNADYVFGTPTLVPNVNTGADDWAPSLSSDGLELYLESDRAGGSGSYDLWVSTRATTDNDWGVPVNLGSTVNSSDQDCSPTISADGLELYFHSKRSGGSGRADVWVTRRATRDKPWGAPMNLGPTINSSQSDSYPCISPEGLELYFTSDRDGWQIWVTRRATTHDDWGTPVRLAPTINSSGYELQPSISANGLILFFCSWRSGGHGEQDIWVTSRPATDAPWVEPVNLGPTVNSSAWETEPTLSHDGRTLYFTSNRSAGGQLVFDIWQVSISPDVDFNGDGKVDLKDMGLLLMVGWGTDNSVYDIGPTPFGDGIVDSKDLMVLADHGAMLAGDVNYDGVVDFLDLAEVANNWLQDTNP